MNYRRKKNPLRFLILLIILGVIAFFGFKGYMNYLSTPLDKNGKIQAFVVNKGETFTDIADRLEKDKIARSSMVLKDIYTSKYNSKPIEPGTVKVSSSMSAEDIVKTLTEGAVDKWVTLLEGWRVEQMAEELSNKIGVDKNEFLENAEEGYMFPDTYLFNPEATPADIASILRNTFEVRYTDEIQNQIKALGLTPEEGVILASLVEREGRSDKVRTEVASD
jgi:UPF0755 protein